jgi:hypothetical protein
MNIFLKKTEDRRKPNRRDFLLQSGCSALGLTTMVNTIAQMKLVGSAAAQSAGDDYKALVCVFACELQQRPRRRRHPGHAVRILARREQRLL